VVDLWPKLFEALGSDPSITKKKEK
jgi:hypothetical protein